MKKLLAIFSLALSSAFATDVTYRVTDFQGAPLGAKVAEMYPFNTPAPNGTNTVSSDRRTAVSSGNGVFTFTNVFMPNCYRIVFKGPYSDSIITNCFDARAATNSTVNGASYLTNFVAVAAMTTNYFIPKTNGISYSQTLTNPALRGTITVNGTNINSLFGSGGTNGGGGGPTYNFDTNDFTVLTETNVSLKAVARLNASNTFAGSLTLTNATGTNVISANGFTLSVGSYFNENQFSSPYAILGAITFGGDTYIDENYANFSGDVTSINGKFNGDGSGLTTLNGTNIQTGTIGTNKIDSTFVSYLGGFVGTNQFATNLVAQTSTNSALQTQLNGKVSNSSGYATNLYTIAPYLDWGGGFLIDDNGDAVLKSIISVFTGTGTGLTNIPIGGVSNLTTRLDAFTAATNNISTNTAKLNTTNTFSAAQTYNSKIVQTVVALTYTGGTNILLDLSLGNKFSLTLTNTAYFLQPTNLTAGQEYLIDVRQDATGGRAVSFNTNYWRFPSGQILTMTTNASAVSAISGFVGSAGTNLMSVQTLNFQ